MRADALRNRGQIVVAARELVAVEGPAVTMEQLADRAGVAVGTLYRHFPTKTALVAAVVAESVEAIAAMADAALERARAGADPAAELEALFRQIAEAFAEDRAVKAAAASLGITAELDPFAAGRDGPAVRAGRSVDELLRAAQEAGRVRGEVTVGDLLMLVSALPDGTADQRARYLTIVLAGLRA